MSIIPDELKAVFEGVVEGRLADNLWNETLQALPNRAIFEKLQRLAKNRDFSLETLSGLPIILGRLAFIQPEDIAGTFDTLADNWLANRTLPLPRLPLQKYKVPTRVWELFWQNVETPHNSDYLDLAAELFGHLDLTQQEKYAGIILNLPGMRQVVAENYQAPPYTLESLKKYPAGSFGQHFYQQMAGNNLKLEDVNPERYTWCSLETEIITRRQTYTHDIWHVVLNYNTQRYGEVALQGVYLAQTTRAFSAFLMATLFTRYILLVPTLLAELLDIIFQGWQIGRQNPPLLPVHWEEFWDLSLDELRRKLGIVPSSGQYSAKIKVYLGSGKS